MFQITINLSDEEAELLAELADSQMRDKTKQAHWILRNFLLKRKVVTSYEDYDDDWVGNN